MMNKDEYRGKVEELASKLQGMLNPNEVVVSLSQHPSEVDRVDGGIFIVSLSQPNSPFPLQQFSVANCKGGVKWGT